MKFVKKIMLPTVFLFVFVARISTGQFSDTEIENKPLRFFPYQSSYVIKQAVFFGPRNNKECPINHEITNPYNIAKTRTEIEQCTADPIACQSAEQEKYRTIDGNCNNLKHPNWGRSSTCLQRILPYDYGDQISYPRMSCKGGDLPNPRLISDVFHREHKRHEDLQTTMFMEWGQLIAHDVSLNDVVATPESNFTVMPNCCKDGPTISDECFSVEVPSTDSFFPQHGVTCTGVARTIPCPLCKGGQRHHWNENTAYLDGSLLYGSTNQLAKDLRSGDQGMMIVETNPASGPMLPTVHMQELCISPSNQKRCYKAGDSRSNQNIFLLAIHTMLLRNHNFICQELHKINPQWDDEKLYQESRRIVIAQIQKISYADYLPQVLGKIGGDLYVLPGASRTEYDSELDAGIVDEYTNAAARYGHTHVPPTFSEVDPMTGMKTKTNLLRNAFYTPFEFQNGQFDRICKGMARDRKMKHDIYITGDLQNFLYRREYMNETTGMDLTAMSIIRGREHGIPGYTAYLKALRNITVASFEDLMKKKLMPDENVNQLQDLFSSVHDVDLYTASLAEYHVSGGLVGETFGIILADQHRRMKFGDRYWFEHGNQPGSFTRDQLVEIKRTTLSRIICETTKISAVQQNVFEPPSPWNPAIPCANIRRFNFNLWKDQTRTLTSKCTNNKLVYSAQRTWKSEFTEPSSM